MENLHPTPTHWLTFLLAAAALHGIWLSVLVFLKNRRESAHRFLSLTLFLVTLYLVNYLFYLTEIIRDLPHLLGVLFPFILMTGPIFYFFIKRSLFPDFKWRLRDLLHLIPFLYGTVSLIPLLSKSAEFKLEIIEGFMSPETEFTWFSMILGNIYMYILMGYVAAGWILIRKTERGKNTQFNILKLRWLKNFCQWFFILLLIDLFVKFFFFAIDIPAFTIEYILAAVIATAIHLTGYLIIGKFDFQTAKIAHSNGNGHARYRTSSLNQNQMELLAEKIKTGLSKDKIYLSPDLKIGQLAAELNIPSHHISQILNEEMKTNFSDLINHYRIEEIKKRLLDTKFGHYSILAIALECGFNNKATFNRVFKKRTGMTPTEFVKINRDLVNRDS